MSSIKLIVDVDKEIYDRLKPSEYDMNDMIALTDAVRTGVSFEKMKEELRRTKIGGYCLHKYTDEYGMVMTVDDVFSIINRYTE